jgi:hypothetical protein
VLVWRGLVPGRSIRFTLRFRTTITIGAASKQVASGIRVARPHATSVAGVIPPRNCGGCPLQGTSDSMPALGTGIPAHPPAGRRHQVIAGPPAPVHAQKARRLRSRGRSARMSGDFRRIGAAGIICPGRGTRASANTSGPDFTCGLWTPVKLRISDPHRTKKTCFFCRTVSRKSELLESDPAV